MKHLDVQRLLIPIDFSETSLLAVDHAVNFAQKCQAELILAHVYEPLIANTGLDFTHLTMGADMENQIMGVIHDNLKELSKRISDHSSVHTSYHVAMGKVSSEIVNMIKKHNVDFVVMGTHGVSGLQEFMLGSNASKIAQLSPVPVLSVQGNAKALGFRKMLLPIDNSHSSRQKVPVAVEIAKRFHAELIVLELVSTNEEESDVMKLNLKVKQVADFVKNHDVACSVHKLIGSDFAEMVIEFSEKNHGDLIIMMTEQEDTLSGVLFGENAQHIINHSKVPVISIPPDNVRDDLVNAIF